MIFPLGNSYSVKAMENQGISAALLGKLQIRAVLTLAIAPMSDSLPVTLQKGYCFYTAP